jgi:chemotaxis protein CheC
MQQNPDDLTGHQQDAIREIGNIGMGHAATALSQMLGKKTHITVPKAKVLTLAELPKLAGDPANLVVGLSFTVLGDVNGKMALIFPGVSALRLADMLLKKPVGSSKILGELGRSALEGAGHVLAGAYLASLNDFLKLAILISLPELFFGQVGGFLDGVARDAKGASHAICIEARFTAASEAVGAGFILVPDAVSIEKIFQAIRKN